VINSSWDVGTMMTNLSLSYLGRKGHKTRWVAWGAAVVGLSCFMRLLPHWLYGPGDAALALTTQFGAQFQPVDHSEYSSAGFQLLYKFKKGLKIDSRP
jgi:hypothetical protein